MLVGNKVDVCTDNPSLRQVSKEEGEKYAGAHGMAFTESSALEDVNVKHAFESLLQSKIAYQNNYRNI